MSTHNMFLLRNMTNIKILVEKDHTKIVIKSYAKGLHCLSDATERAV